MTNNQIIRNEAARLDPATLHAIATAHHTPDEIAAIAAACKTTDENGNEQPATVADVEIMLAADELHTFDHWKKEGKSVKKGEKHLVCCYLWKYTTKPSKEQREKAAAEGKEAAPDPHYYPTKSHLFSCLQVESSKPAPAGRFGSTAAIIEYNKKLAAERKAAKAAAEKAKAEATAPIITEEHHELPELVHVDPHARELLTDQLNKEQDLLEYCKGANAYYRKHKTLRGYSNMSDAAADALTSPDAFSMSLYRKPYGDFELTSIRGKIKRIQTRLDELDKVQATAASGPVEDQHDGYTYRENNEIMRVQFIFPGKPDDETRAMLKENGFRWAPSQGAWQRQLTANAKYAAHRVMEFLDGNESE